MQADLAGEGGKTPKAPKRSPDFLPPEHRSGGRLVGYLWKFTRGKGWNQMAGWHPRFVVLDKHAGTIAYYKNQKAASRSPVPTKAQATRKSGLLYLNHEHARIQCLGELEAKSTPPTQWSMQVTQGGGVSIGLCATNQEDFDIWKGSIQCTVERKYLEDPRFGVITPKRAPQSAPAGIEEGNGSESSSSSDEEEGRELSFPPPLPQPQPQHPLPHSEPAEPEPVGVGVRLVCGFVVTLLCLASHWYGGLLGSDLALLMVVWGGSTVVALSMKSSPPPPKLKQE